MNRRCLHIFLALLVLAQPVAMSSAWAASIAAPAEETQQMSMPMVMDMPGCHDASPSAPDCCDDMDGVLCDMDCGTASPALGQPLAALDLALRASQVTRTRYAAPRHPPSSLFKPPRTS